MNKTPRRATKIVALAAGVALVGTGTAYAAGSGRKGTSKARTGVTAVEVARATVGTAASALSLSGTVVPTTSLPLAAGASGRVSVLDVSVGQHVNAGQALMSVTDPVLQAQLAAAQAAVGTAQAKLSAAEAPPSGASLAVANDGLAKAQAVLSAAEVAYQQAVAGAQGGRGTGSQTQLDSAAEAVAVAQAGLTLAEAQSAQAEAPPSSASLAPLVAAVTQAQAAQAVIGAEVAQESLTAPSSGTVSSLSVAVGQTVAAGTTVMTLDGLGMTVQAPVSQASVSLVRAGQTATLSVLGASNNLAATVTAVSTSASASSLTFEVTLTPVASPPSWLHPGESAAASVVTSSTPSAILVPASAIVSINGHPQVFVVSPATKPATANGSSATPSPRGSGAASPTKKNAGKGKGKGKGKKNKTRKAIGATAKGGAPTVSLVDVTPTVSDGSTTEVSGLSPGALVVVAGQTYLAQGDRVKVASTLTVANSVTGSSVGGILTAPTAAPTAAPTKITGTGGGVASGAGAGTGGGSARKGGAGAAG